jgi:hypothetical protein
MHKTTDDHAFWHTLNQLAATKPIAAGSTRGSARTTPDY